MNVPIKRHESLKSLSHDHHHGLLLCWKIRTGFKKQIEINRLKSYTDWFFKNHLSPHFDLEEKYVFPVLGQEHELVKKALAEHRRLKRLFEDTADVGKNLSLIEEELDAHIRFEERTLFKEIQNTASPEVLEEIMEKHDGFDSDVHPEDWEDEFWK